MFNSNNAMKGNQFVYKVEAHTARGFLLHVSVIERDLCAVAWLLEQRMGVDIQDSKGRTPLFLATVLQEFDMAEILLQHNASKTKKSKLGRAPSQLVRESPSVAWKILFNDGSDVLTNNAMHVHTCMKIPVPFDSKVAKSSVTVELRGDGMAELQGLCMAELPGLDGAKLHAHAKVEFDDQWIVELQGQRMAELQGSNGPVGVGLRHRALHTRVSKLEA